MRRRTPRSARAHLAGVALAVTLGLVAGGCGDDAEGGGAGGDAAALPVDAAAVAAADLEQGADVYQARCAVCHGADGGGGLGPDLTGSAEALTVEEHVDVVRQGRSGMPAFEGQLDDDELAAVVRYEREGW